MYLFVNYITSFGCFLPPGGEKATKESLNLFYCLSRAFRGKVRTLLVLFLCKKSTKGAFLFTFSQVRESN